MFVIFIYYKYYIIFIIIIFPVNIFTKETCMYIQSKQFYFLSNNTFIINFKSDLFLNIIFLDNLVYGN